MASKRLSVSAVLFAIVGGIVGIALGLGLGLLIGSALAAAFHVSQMEGAAGYFAVSIALIVTVVAVPVSILLTLSRRSSIPTAMLCRRIGTKARAVPAWVPVTWRFITEHRSASLC